MRKNKSKNKRVTTPSTKQAQYYLGLVGCISNDLHKALKHLRKAAELGHPKAPILLREINQIRAAKNFIST